MRNHRTLLLASLLATSGAMTAINTRETAVAMHASPSHAAVAIGTLVVAALVVRSAVRCTRTAKIESNALDCEQ